MTRYSWPVVAAIVVALFLPASRRSNSQPLPGPELRGGTSLWTVLATRRSMRTFGPRDPTTAQLAQLLWAAQGTVDSHRTAPSAGALYPLTLRVVNARGVWRYESEDHALHHEWPDNRRAAVADASYFQASLRAAPITIVITAEIGITAAKYGRPAAERFVALEAGHAAQNLLLAATALDLAAVPVGAFDEAALRRALDLPAPSTPLYLVAIGTKP